jgi:hypothetical protein
MSARARSALAIVIALLGSSLLAGGAPAVAGELTSASAVAIADSAGAAGRDYATDVFGDPWDYSNTEDLLLDGGPAGGMAVAGISGGLMTARFSGDGSISPLWGGYTGSLLLGRDGGRAGNALASGTYQQVAFQAYSSRDVPAGLFWFNCPGGGAGSECGGGMAFQLKAGWNVYLLTPGGSMFNGWPVAWGGSLNGLRLAVSPGGAGSDFAIDWFRVVKPNSGAVVSWSNPGGGAADVVWDADGQDSNNNPGQPNWGVLASVSGASGSVDLSALPAANYRVGIRKSGAFANWNNVALSTPLPRFITPNEVGDKDYATTVLGNPWDMNGADDVSGVGNATNVSFANGQLAATNTSNDPFAWLRLAAGGIDSRIYRNLTITSGYDGKFDLADAAGGGTMARVIWARGGSGSVSQTNDILTYSGTRTVSIDMGLPDDQLLEPEARGQSFVSSTPVTALRWDPNEDRGARRWYVQDVQLRSDFATTGTFPISWQDAAYAAGGTAQIVADTDRSGCNGRTVATGLPVTAGANTTNWNTAGVPSGRYWLCLTITRGAASTSAYAGGVLVVGANPPSGPEPDPNPLGNWDAAVLSGRTLQFGGWAFDTNAPQQQINVDIYDRRPDGTEVGYRQITGGSRSDVAAAFAGAGGNTGFNGSIPLSGAGRHSVCAIAINVGAGSNKLLGCRDIVLPGPAGYVDSATNSTPSQITVSGWAGDPDAPTSPMDVHVYVTGPGGSAFGVLRSGQPRADVRSALGWIGGNSGYSGTVPTAGAGENRVCAYAINIKPPSTNPPLGCRTVQVRNAFGFLDSVAVAGGQIIASGWALNPNLPPGTVEIHVYDAGPTTTRGYPGFQANRSRPDVGGAFPGYGPSHGFSASVPAIGAGRHTVCVYAITTGGGAGNTHLGCQAVTVP